MLNVFVGFGVQKLNACIVKIIEAHVKVIDLPCSKTIIYTKREMEVL